MRRVRSILRRRVCAISTAVLASLPAIAAAQTSQWIGGTSNWSNPANWSPFGVPNDDIANVTSTLGAAQTITYDNTGSSGLKGLVVDLTGGFGNASETFFMPADFLAVFGNEYVGYSGLGNFNQTGGVNILNGGSFLDLGYETGSIGTYELGGSGMLQVNANEYLGGGPNGGGSGNSVGILNQSGGNNAIIGGFNLDLGYGASSGIYTLGGGMLVSQGAELVGYDGGSGNFNQSGGTNSVSGSTGLDLGDGSGSTGTYTLSGSGTLLVSGGEVVGGAAGANGAGFFNQSGGYNTVSGTAGLQVGLGSGSTGKYTLSGGSLFVAVSEYIGASSSGSSGAFNQSGGSNVINGGVLGDGLYIGGSGSTSAYTLSGGTLSILGIEVIGSGGGVASFNQSGGTNSVIGYGFALVGGTGSTNSYTLSGGMLSVAGGESMGQLGAVLFNQSGGTNKISGNNSSFSIEGGAYVLSGGTFSVTGTEEVGSDGSAIFNQSGGTNSLTGGGELDVSGFTNSTGSYLLSGGLLSVDGNAYIGGTSSSGFTGKGTGILTVSNTGQMNVTGILKLLSGSLNLEGGSLTVGELSYPFQQLVWTAGTLALTNQSIGIDSFENFANFGDSAGAGDSFAMGTGQALQVNGYEYVGVLGTGTFQQSGGMNTITGQGLVVGNVSGSTGTYTLSGSGALSVTGNECIGFGGGGTFYNFGGTNTVFGGELDIGAVTGAIGVYDLLSGELVVNGNAYIGGASTESGGTGTLTVYGPAQLNVTGTMTVFNGGLANIDGAGATLGGLAIHGNGVVNVDSPLRIQYGSGADPISSIESYLLSGRDGGAWNGSGINSSFVSTLNMTTSLTYAVGYIDGALPPANFKGSISSGTIEIMPTLAGDATLSGTVDFYDFQVVLSNFGKANQSWDEGDFDYTGTVDFYDFQVVLSNFGQNYSGLSSGELAMLNQFAGQYGEGVVLNSNGLSLVSVPEPAGAGVCAMVTFGLLNRRRRKFV